MGSRKARKRNKSKNTDASADWVERRIYINAKYDTGKSGGNSSRMDKDGKVKQGVFISGFLRHQPYGPKHSLRKWVYIDGFESSRWANREDKRITVDVRANPENNEPINNFV